MTPIFFQKAEELRDRWDTLVSQDRDDSDIPTLHNKPGPPDVSTHTLMDVAHWISRATFDVVGLAGFDYHFHALRGESEELYLAYRRMFNVIEKGIGLRGILQLFFPFLEKIWVSPLRCALSPYLHSSSLSAR